MHAASARRGEEAGREKVRCSGGSAAPGVRERQPHLGLLLAVAALKNKSVGKPL